MKKLGVILLAMAFVFGLAIQASAVELVEPEIVEEIDKKEVFGEDDPIMFEGIYCTDEYSGIEITDRYDPDFGVTFSGGLYQESFFSSYYMLEDGVADWDTASNINDCRFGETPPVAPAITVTFDPPVTRVGFYGRSPEGEIKVTVFRGGVASEPILFNTVDAMEFIGIKDSKGIEEIEVRGTGLLYWIGGALFIDEFRSGGVPDTGPADIIVEAEIRPPNCLGAKIPIDGKSINEKSRGVTPVVIVGNPTYDVTEIDPATVLLQGVAPVRDAIEYASHCNAENGDDELDLVLKFNTQELVDAMEISPAERKAVANGEWPSKPLQLTGNLFEDSGGTAINGEVSVTLVGKLKPANENRGKGSMHGSDRYQRHDRGHHHGWHKSHGQHKHHGWDNH